MPIIYIFSRIINIIIITNIIEVITIKMMLLTIITLSCNITDLTISKKRIAREADILRYVSTKYARALNMEIDK